MSKHIHLNLINEEELVSSSPVRTQTIAPFFITVITLSMFAWWLYLYMNYNGLKKVNAQHVQLNQQIQPTYNKVLELTAKEKELTALNAQMTAFNHSKLKYSYVLSCIPELVDPNIQFTMIQLLAPPVPLFAKDKIPNGPTNTFETTEFTIKGKAAGTKVDTVDQLLNSLNIDSFTNLIQTAFIPKGAFQQDSKSGKEKRDFLLFEIKCRCQPRRFQ